MQVKDPSVSRGFFYLKKSPHKREGRFGYFLYCFYTDWISYRELHHFVLQVPHPISSVYILLICFQISIIIHYILS